MAKDEKVTSDWWSTHTPAETEERLASPEPLGPTLHPPVAEHGPVGSTEAGQEEEAASSRGRSMAVKVVGGVAGVLVVGALMLNASSGEDDSKAAKPSPTALIDQADGLPAAGGGVHQDDLPAAGGNPVPPREEKTPIQQTKQAPREVTLTASPSGRGQVGSIMKISIRNNTEKSLTLMATLVRGDGRAGVVGEGTLAPGSRVVGPGQTVQGTVEFSSPTAPHQVALVDLSGNIVAASGED